MIDPDDHLVTIREAARRLGLCTSTDSRVVQDAATKRLLRRIRRAEREIGATIRQPASGRRHARAVSVSAILAACPEFRHNPPAATLRDLVLATLREQIDRQVIERTFEVLNEQRRRETSLISLVKRLSERVDRLELLRHDASQRSTVG